MRINKRMMIQYLRKKGMLPANMFFRRSSRPWQCQIITPLRISIVRVGDPLNPVLAYWLEQLITKEFGHCNELLLFLFVLFHEIGHYYAWQEGIENNPCQEYAIKILYNVADLTDRFQILAVEKKYRELAVEAYCDQFAIKQIKTLFDKERRSLCEN